MATITTFTYNNSTNGIGGAIAGAITNATDGNVFPNITLAEASVGVTKYRCIYLTAGAYTYTELAMYIASTTQSVDTKVFIGLGAASIGADETPPADELTAPTGVTFLHPTNLGYTLDLPDLTSGQRIAIWIKLVVNASADGADSDYCRLYLDGIQV